MLVKRTVYDELFKTVNAIDTSDLLQKAGYNTKIEEIENKISDHEKNIATCKFNKLMEENFVERLMQANLAS